MLNEYTLFRLAKARQRELRAEVVSGARNPRRAGRWITSVFSRFALRASPWSRPVEVRAAPPRDLGDASSPVGSTPEKSSLMTGAT